VYHIFHHCRQVPHFPTRFTIVHNSHNVPQLLTNPHRVPPILTILMTSDKFHECPHFPSFILIVARLPTVFINISHIIQHFQQCFTTFHDVSPSFASSTKWHKFLDSAIFLHF
jgi:hypothetical protein